MLQCLRIRNLAVIDDLTWDLEEGLNVLTGETGAGKSIMLDALDAVLGGRVSQRMIR
ncbi:MAG: AAA family ATPase, partial [Verrucomicrobiota bacterium]